jgi:hypothetical protein
VIRGLTRSACAARIHTHKSHGCIVSWLTCEADPGLYAFGDGRTPYDLCTNRRCQGCAWDWKGEKIDVGDRTPRGLDALVLA